MTDEPGYIYLLHFEEPISERHTTQHYVGWASNLANRIKEHVSGNGKSARLTQVAKERNIKFKVVRVWCGTRSDERAFKNRKCAPRYCPHCGNPMNVTTMEELTKEEILEMLS